MDARRFFSLMLLSGSSLLFELALTRLVSAVYYPPYVFAMISLAVLGIGLGSALAAWRPGLRAERYEALYLTGAALACLPVLFVLALNGNAALIFVLVPLPYLCIGLTFASIFSRAPERSSLLYMADLVGAGLGAILSIPVMNAISPVNTVLLAALLLTIAGLYPASGRRFQFVAALIALVLLISNIGAAWLKIDYAALNTGKPIQTSLATGQIIQTRWDAFGRTDLVNPGDGSPYVLYLDGAAASVMPPQNDNGTLIRKIGFFPFATNQPARVFLIGPGGGLDVWFGLNANAQSITAVEVNPASIDFVREFGDYNGHLYDNAAVRVVTDEGRSLLKRENVPYDLIFLSQVVTLTSERIGYALTENTIYTREAFQDYFAHLTDTGAIALVLYDEITLTRALSTALSALTADGMTDAEAVRHMMAFVDTGSGKPVPLLIISKTALTHEDGVTYLAVAKQVGFEPLYIPDVIAQPPLDTIESGEHTFSEIVAQSASDISATTDDHPFFFQFERGLAPDLIPLLALIAAGAIIGAIVLVIAQRKVESRAVRWSPVYFAALGLGFMLIEITVIQQTRMFLGHPALAATTSIAVLLVGGGIGSWFSGKFKSALFPLVGVMVISVLWVLLWPLLSQNFLALPAPGRVGVVVVCLLPLAFFMGMPFPIGLRRAASGGNGQIALAWAINGFATVAGSVGATALATLAGYQSVWIAGIAVYLVAAVYTLMPDAAERPATEA